MASDEYHFVTRWQVEGSIQEVSDILEDVDSLVRWWPSVYLHVKTLEPGDEINLGKVVGLYTKGWLPYTLRWQFRVTESNAPYGFALTASGDFDGEGVWTLEQAGPVANVTYDWKIRAGKLLLRSLSFLLKPVFSANHRWAMAKGEDGLKLELARRRAPTQEESAGIPDPPFPTTCPVRGPGRGHIPSQEAAMAQAPQVTTHRNYIGGSWVESVSGRTYTVYNPAHKDVAQGVVQASQAEDATAAIEAADAAFPAWAGTPAPQRASVLYRALEIMRERQEDIARTSPWGRGSPWPTPRARSSGL